MTVTTESMIAMLREGVLQAANALAAHYERSVNVGPISLAPVTEAALWINLRNALDATRGACR